MASSARAHPWREAYRVAPDAIRAQCGAWNVGDAGPESRAAPAFPGPALLLAGALDPVIPISDVRRLAVSLPKSRLIEFPATGHDAELAWWACVDDLITEFLRDPGARTTTQPGDVACRRTANAMRFPSLGQAEKLPLR